MRHGLFSLAVMMEGKLSGNHLTRAVSRGQNKLIGEFKMGTDDVISVRG